MRAAAVMESLREEIEHVGGGQNPWVNDYVLLNLSVWWVKATRPHTPDFASEVALVFESLQRDLRQNP